MMHTVDQSDPPQERQPSTPPPPTQPSAEPPADDFVVLHAEMDKLTTPERIDRMHALRTEHMTAMNAAMDKREDATKTFYAALNADQKKVFDAEHARMGGRHGEHRGPWGHKAADKPAAK